MANTLGNSYNNVDYGMDRTMQNAKIELHPMYVDMGCHDESTTDDIGGLYQQVALYEKIYDEFKKSPFYEKYGKLVKKKKPGQKIESVDLINGPVKTQIEDSNPQELAIMEDDYIDSSIIKDLGQYDFRKIDKADTEKIYYYFKDILLKENYNDVEIFCGIAEFFHFNYKTLYDDVLSIENKAKILTLLRENNKIKFQKENKLY